jgi:hypothetical protein
MPGVCSPKKSEQLARRAHRREQARLRRITKLRKSLAPELSAIIFRYVLDDCVPDEFIIQEFPSAGNDPSPAKWVRGLEKTPEMLMIDGWFFKNCGKLMFDDYYATIQIDVSAKYPNWRHWIQEWLGFSGAIKRVLLVFDGFDEVNVLSLAEIAYFFAQSDFIVRAHKQPLALAHDRRNLIGNGAPKEQILVKVIVGQRSD